MELDLAPQVKDALMNRWEPVYRSQLHYLVTWSTRGRRPVLKDKHLEALHRLIRAACEERGYQLIEVVSGHDHVHVLMALRPTQSVASAVRELKGLTTRTLMQDHPELRVWMKGNLLWDERYAVETVSPLRLERMRARLAHSHRAANDPMHPEVWAAAS